jgi:hypothetical protein
MKESVCEVLIAVRWLQRADDSFFAAMSFYSMTS